MNEANESGRAAAGAPSVICLHCSGSSPRQWDLLIEHLRPELGAVAPALVGYGDDAQTCAAGIVTLDDEARRIEPLLDESAAPVHLVAHSFGAAVALRIARRRPWQVASLALYEPVLFNLLLEVEAQKPWADEVLTVGRSICDAAVAGNALRASEIFVDYWSGSGTWSTLSEGHQFKLAQRAPAVTQNFETLFAETATLDSYRHVTVPTLLLVGRCSKMPTNRIANLLAAVMPRATLRELGGMGHMGPITHAYEVNALIRSFLLAHDEDRRCMRDGTTRS